ncbi:MAG: hypothetical protein HZA50_09375, partial [Planctomycetes bacterium]|nr:hypothetical protein [Planctomycetota bacterium]
MKNQFGKSFMAWLVCLAAFAPVSWCQNTAGKTKDKPATPEEVQKAIQKGVDFLLSIQKPEGNWEPAPLEWDKTGIGFLTGPTGAAIYALLECGVDVKDPKIVKALDWLVKNQDKESKTYSVGLRCNAWFIANKLTKNAYRKNLEKDVNMCVVTG